MRTILQRVLRAEVHVDGACVGRIGVGVLALVGVERGDGPADAVATAQKIAALRMFPGRTPMDRTLEEVGGGVLVVSQFTLAGSLRKGRRPSFDDAADPGPAEALYERVATELESCSLPVARGRFGAHMRVELVNDGPVTFILATRDGRVL